MKFKALFSVQPPSYFGLPDGDKTVVPVPAEIVGPALDLRSRKLVDYGSLSRFRQDGEKIQLSTQLTGMTLTVRDNFFELACESPDLPQAIKSAVTTMERLLRHLTVEQGELFTSTFMQIENERGQVMPDPLSSEVQILGATFYNLPELKERIGIAASRAGTTDVLLGKALFYYEHARLLFNLRSALPAGSEHSRFLIAAIYLNAWKALTTILGDPSTDSDYQRRFQKLGFPGTYWKDTVAPLKAVRDRDDVAHYSLSGPAAGVVEGSFAIADGVCREVLQRYADQLVDSARSKS